MSQPERGVSKDQKRGTWMFACDAPGAGGKRRQVRRRGFTSMEKANAAVRAFRQEVGADRVPAPAVDSVTAFAKSWVMALPTEGVEPATVKHYHEAVTRLLPTIGTVKLQELTALDLDRAYAALLDLGRAARTVRASHVAAKKMLTEAVRVRKVGCNVATDARPPRAKAARAKSFKIWTYPETVRFLAAVEGNEHHAAYAVAAHTGLRRGELVALRWDAVDLDDATVTVERSIGKGLDGLHDKQPKSDAGRRVVEVDEELVDLLRRHRQAQRERRLAFGPGWRDEHGLVFVEIAGEAIHPDRLSKKWSDLARRQAKPLGLSPIRLHDLRHSHATALLAAGVRADVVSARLGHSSVAFTLSTYAHRSEGDQRAALARLRAAR